MDKTNRSLVPASPMPAPLAPAAIDDGFIKSRIHTIRGEQVMLSPDLADLYQVETRAFNQAVKRNEERFPPSFRFQLTKEELRKVITNCDNPDRLRFSPQTPYAFTEQGVAMLSGILNSAIAVRVSIRIMETFVAMRKALASIAPVMARLAEAERRARICCTNVAFASPGIVVDSSLVRAQRMKRPLCPATAPAPFSIPDERATLPAPRECRRATRRGRHSSFSARP